MAMTMRFLAPRYGAPLLLCLMAASTFGHAQESARERESDNPEQREKWFMRGRTVPGQVSAELLQRAYQRKMQKRASDRLRLSVAEGAAAAQVNLQPSWTNLGPTPVLTDANRNGSQDYGGAAGRVTAIAIDQADPSGNTVYVGGASGGLWRSTNAATANPANVQWTPLIDDQATLAVGAIALKPGSSSTILVGTGEPNFAGGNYYGLGILRSTNGGGSWTQITSADNGAEPFKGLGVTSFAFSTSNTSLVVVGLSGLTNGSNLGAIPNAAVRGIYYSTDSGATWKLASIKDGATTIDQGSVPSVVYNPVSNIFMAAVRFHGIYTSTDGINWSRLANQPSATLSTANCPATPVSTGCPMGRGQLSVQPNTGEAFLWYVNDNEVNQGVFKTGDNGATWIAMSTSGITGCGDSDGCGSSQGLYNLEVAAVPNPTGTDLYVGAVNLFKCVVNAANPTCAASPFLNLSHSYGCNPTSSLAHFHPDQHGIDYSRTTPAVMYFGNDGGIYRTLNSSGLNTGSCSGTNPFENLSGTIGSMVQFVWLAVSASDGTTMVGGTQDNGSPSRTSGNIWQSVLLGDGGFTDINPANPNEWFTENPNTLIYRCTLGPNCTDTLFGSPVASSSNMAGDVGDFYTPFMLDPKNTSQLIVGTCRVWRGPSNGIGWTVSANALSNNFNSGSATTCTGSEASIIEALAAGGPTTANGSEVMYAGTANGRIFVTTNASAGPSSWQERSIANPSGYLISSIAVDPAVTSGQTAYLTVMGFGTGHVFKTTNAGATWTDITGDLPDAPADAVLVDPNDSTIIYAGTDVGVFVTTNGGAHWTEYSVTSGPGLLPNVAITRLVASNTGSVKKLRASTYGRGVFETALLSNPAVIQGTLQLSANSLTFASTGVGSTSVSQTVTLTALTAQVNSIVIANNNSAEFPSSSNCGATLAAGVSCIITVSFSPSATGGRSGALTITSDGVGSPQTVTLSGTGTQPSVPVLTSISPGTAAAGGAGFTLTVNGTGFTSLSVVQWNGSNRTTTFVNSTQLTAAIPASDIAVGGTATVAVFTPAPGGGTSAAASFFITAPGSFPLAQLRYWPHIVAGGTYVTKLTIVNLTDAQNSVVVYTLSQAGATLTTTSYSLAPAATVRFQTPESGRFGPQTIQWAIVNSAAAVGINLFFEVVQDGSTGFVVNTVGFNDSPPLTDFTLPVEFQPTPPGFPIGRTIGIAIGNTTNTTGTITFKLIDQNGNVIATAVRTLGPFAQTALDFQISVPEFGAVLPAANFIGSVTVSSTVPISAVGLEDDLGPFSAIPPIPGRAK
jgi:hypothetical protein